MMIQTQLIRLSQSKSPQQGPPSPGPPAQKALPPQPQVVVETE